MKKITKILAMLAVFALAFSFAGCSSDGNSSDDGTSSGSSEQIPEGFVKVTAGTFQMGGQDSKPVHKVTLTRSFYMCDHEVTQAEYKFVIGSLPSDMAVANGNSDNNPVNEVSWYDAIVYCNKRSMEEGLTSCYTIKNSTDSAKWGTVPTSDKDAAWNAVVCDFTANGYRLPTEAEWEYGARAGNKNVDGIIYSGTDSESNLGDYAWYDNTDGKTYEVKKKKPNSYGLYDMSGNVWEWCWDLYGEVSAITETDPTGASSGSSRRVLRGGSFCNLASSCSVSRRFSDTPVCIDATLGFRVVRTAK